MRIERHDVNRRTVFLPATALVTHACWQGRPPEHCTEAKDSNGEVIGYHMTLLDELRNKPNSIHRMDILLKTTKRKQYAVYPGPGGTINGDLGKFSAEDLEWAREESRKCSETAEQYPEYARLLR